MLLPCMCREMFQFTHPGRGATEVSLISSVLSTRFNSRTPGGVRLVYIITYLQILGFNSRTPGGVRLGSLGKGSPDPVVSIHAPREGCDWQHPPLQRRK